MLKGNTAMDSHPGGSKKYNLAASRYSNQGMRWPDGPLDLHADFTFKYDWFWFYFRLIGREWGGNYKQLR